MNYFTITKGITNNQTLDTALKVIKDIRSKRSLKKCPCWYEEWPRIPLDK